MSDSKYNPKEFEKKWRERWLSEEIYKTPTDPSPENKKYILDMFPYPSGEGLHVGHVEGYTANDIYSRYLRMKGKDVLHPMGWDAFGLPAENYAIKTKVHPSITTDKAASNFKAQMNQIGLSYDWSREIQTSKPDYYRWTQWFFLLLYKNGLAYKKKAKVNWCPSCQTVLANEQVVGSGVCNRCGTEVVQKDLEQWFFKITNFIEDQEYQGKKIKGLISGLSDIDWPESTKLAQKNWIGRSEGASVKFEVRCPDSGVRSPETFIEVFTTRPDTLFGCTFMVISSEHSILEKLADSITNLDEIKVYQEQARKKTELERTDLAKEKTGIEIQGLKAINPVNQKEVPIFIADYILSTYGFGAIMAVPAHDQRDYEFAKKYNLEIVEVVKGGDIQNQAYTEEGIAVNSDFLDNLPTHQAKVKMIIWSEKNDQGKRMVNYKLRDWLISRQRYWGAPIPIIYCDQCGEVPVPDKELPVILPDDVDFNPKGDSPLVSSKIFHDVNCPKCGGKARRESDTMDTFVCSSWYYFRFTDHQNEQEFASEENVKKWLPVDAYLGGAEHTVLHLLYSRFFTKVLQKYGYVEFNEPFLKLRHQGLILAEDNNKMSKSKGNVVNPDDVAKDYSADTLRLYEMFMGPLEATKPWNTKGIIGVYRFLDKVWQLADKIAEKAESKEVARLLNKTIKKVGEDIESFKFNTAISQLMILVNSLVKEDSISRDTYLNLLKILAPLTPFLAEEQWNRLGENFSIHQSKWPEFDLDLVQEEQVKLAVQINGKVRGTVEVARGSDEEAVIKVVKEDPIIQKYLQPEIKKTIFVSDKIINFIV